MDKWDKIICAILLVPGTLVLFLISIYLTIAEIICWIKPKKKKGGEEDMCTTSETMLR